MQFTLVALLSLVAVAIAGPVPMPDRLDDIVARAPQATDAPAVNAEAPAMSDANGNVVNFDSTAVYLDATTKGN